MCCSYRVRHGLYFQEGRIRELDQSLVQSHPFGPKTSFTLRHSSSSEKGPCMRALNEPSGAQLSCQSLRLLFLPGIHLIPLLETLLPFFIACQTLKHGSLSMFLAFNLQLVQYLLLRTLAHKAPFSIWNHQLSFARSA